MTSRLIRVSAAPWHLANESESEVPRQELQLYAADVQGLNENDVAVKSVDTISFAATADRHHRGEMRPAASIRPSPRQLGGASTESHSWPTRAVSSKR
jgi:hypothetical protein